MMQWLSANWPALVIVLLIGALLGHIIWCAHREESGALTDEEREKLAPLRFHKDVAMQLTSVENESF